MSSLKERGRVKGGIAPFVRFPAGFRVRQTEAIAVVAWDWSAPCFLIAAIPGERRGQVKDRAEPGRAAAPQASLRRPAVIP